MGLSPRVRGNLHRLGRTAAGHGSIPACAGEPGYAAWLSHPKGSIPACAGEPLFVQGPWQSGRVYPRVCGGTRGHAG